MNAEDVINEVKNMTEKKIRRFSEPGRRGIRRPEEILRDVRGLKLRQRVSLVLGDELLREELEDTIRNSTVNGVSRGDTIRTFQDFLLPTLQPSFVSIGKGSVAGGGASAIVLPINDVRGEHTLDYSKNERLIRCKLAAVYRLVDIFGWSEGIFNHISVRVAPDKDEFLLNPFGLLFSEVTASSLIKCDTNGSVLARGSTSLDLNKAGFVLHSAIHECRPDIMCAIHVHTPSVIAVSAMKCGFLRLSQESLIVGEVSYHNYHGILINDEEKESIAKDLGPTSMVLFLKNHGVVVCGKTIEDALMLLSTLMDACETQVKVVSVGLENLNIISDEAYQQVQEITLNNEKIFHNTEDKEKQRTSLSQLYFEAYMRWLDSQGYRTGYVYRIPDIFISGEPKKMRSSTVPPQATSDRDLPYHVYHNQQENTVRRSHSLGHSNTFRNRVKWLNNPVQGIRYVKEERVTQPSSLLEEELDVNEMSDSHMEETESIVETPVNGETRIVTKTTTVTETKVVKDQSKEVMKEHAKKVIMPEPANEVDLGADVNENQKNIEKPISDEKVNKLAKSVNPPNEENFTQPTEAISKSPTKVKKSKSFKKALMKRFNKKDENHTE